jgi:hypothetical protein
MSAVDPLRAAQDRRQRLRAVRRAEEEASQSRRLAVLKCTYRPADANFFCWKYGVWYNVMDCCYRHDHGTYSGCSPCGQGASNLKANLERYRATRHLGDPPRARR